MQPRATKKKKKLSDKRLLRDFFAAELAEARTAKPACRHFGDCGGCEFQDVPYERQVKAKVSAFGFIADTVMNGFREKEDAAKADLLQRSLSDVTVESEPSPLPLGYRQRMDYVFAFGKAGLRRVNRHRQVVDLEECPLLGDDGFAVFQEARRRAEAAGLESYDYMRHTGELRYFVVRRSRTGGILLSLVTKTESPRDAVMAVLQSLYDEGRIVSGHWLHAPGLGDVSFGQRLDGVGDGSIAENLNGIKLRIGPNTFFQSNPAVAEKAYAAIQAFVPPGAEVLDLYSGVGSIALSVASGACRVTAVENVPENVALAEVNIRDNDIHNVRLLVDDSAAYLRYHPERPDLLVVNPPRPGVEGDGMATIAALGPARLAYLSCNPFTLLRNLAEILDQYRIRSIRVYDMFPATRHFETLALLERTA
ncbi:MAG: 23S rRNA (uracil(1939)-C(5))-methyltransferase RlmD [Planctomycetaceae bacterium]|nr:23S rRNA (uracil(1939)-C(5))-methyltransferase RlmD [Planctomycetaceae bacterium]